MFHKDEQIGCRVHLNPNGSDLRCGDRINNLFGAPQQLCEMCQLRKRNSTLVDMLNRRRSHDNT